MYYFTRTPQSKGLHAEFVLNGTWATRGDMIMFQSHWRARARFTGGCSSGAQPSRPLHHHPPRPSILVQVSQYPTTVTSHILTSTNAPGISTMDTRSHLPFYSSAAPNAYPPSCTANHGKAALREIMLFEKMNYRNSGYHWNPTLKGRLPPPTRQQKLGGTIHAERIHGREAYNQSK